MCTLLFNKVEFSFSFFQHGSGSESTGACHTIPTPLNIPIFSLPFISFQDFICIFHLLILSNCCGE